jgi:hypothetical protein
VAVTAGQTGQGYCLTRVYKICGDVVRVRIERDAYLRQSFAVAEVLAADRTWTALVTNPASNWHGSTPSHASEVPEVLGFLADGLAIRATTILGG